MYKFGLIVVFYLLFSSLVVSLPDVDNPQLQVESKSPDGEFVMGRKIENEYSYETGETVPQVSFVLDDSGSMGSEIDEVKDNMRDFINDLGDGARGSVVTFKGNDDYSEIYTSQEFTDDANQLEDTVDDITATGGGPCEEPATKALDHSQGLDWQDGENKIMILLIGYGYWDPSGMENLADSLASQGYTVYTVSDNLGCNSQSETEIIHDYVPDTTGGNHYQFGDDWSVILDEIEDDIGGVDATLNSVIDVNSYSDDQYSSVSDYGAFKNYQRSVEMDDGVNTNEFVWRPTNHGDLNKKTGEDFLRLEQDGETEDYYFSSQENMFVNYVDFNVVDFDALRENSGDVEVDVIVENIGTADSRSREISIVDGSGDTVTESLPPLSPGESQIIDFTMSPSSPVLSNVENLELIADYQGYWDSVSDSEVGVSFARGDTLEPNENNNEIDFGYPPHITSIDFQDWTDHHGFEVTANINMLTSGGNFGQCQMSFEDQDGNRYPSNGMIKSDLIAVSSTNAECNYDSINNSISGFEVYDNIDVNVSVEDEKGTSNWDAGTHEIPNQAPEVDLLVSPHDDSIVVGEEADLEVEVSDSEGDEFNLTFFNAREDTVIEEVEDAHLQSNHNYTWEIGLGDFEWGVRLEDPYDTHESTWNFRRVISDSFRLSKTIEHQYSSLIVTESGRSTMLLEIVNTHPEPKNITTEASTLQDEVSVSFASYNGGVYQLDSGESKRFQLEVEAGEVDGFADDALRFNSTDQQIGAETVEEFPVYVRSSEQESRGVPGLTGTMIFIIGLVSILLFGLSV